LASPTACFATEIKAGATMHVKPDTILFDAAAHLA
jgi:hypothetical protein